MYPIKSVKINRPKIRLHRKTNSTQVVHQVPKRGSAPLPKELDQGIHELYCSLMLMTAR